MTNYARGRRAEYHARDVLQDAGYMVVRAAGSRGAWDLVALPMNGGRVLLVQVKRGPRVRAGDVSTLLTLPVPAGAVAELWHVGDDGVQRYRRIGTDVMPMRGETFN